MGYRGRQIHSTAALEWVKSKSHEEKIQKSQRASKDSGKGKQDHPSLITNKDTVSSLSIPSGLSSRPLQIPKAGAVQVAYETASHLHISHEHPPAYFKSPIYYI